MAALENDEIEESGFTCFWSIENFKCCKPSPDLELVSKIFRVRMLGDSQWHLEFHEVEKGMLSIFLFKDANPGNTNMTYSFALLTNTGWVRIYDNFKRKFSTDGNGWGIKPFMKWAELIRQKHVFLPNGTLTISLRMWNDRTAKKSAQCFMSSYMFTDGNIMNLSIQEHYTLKPSSVFNLLSECISIDSLGEVGKAEEVCDKSTQPCSNKNNSMFQDIEDIFHQFENNKFHYVTLRTADRDFIISNTLLCASSPVFRAMFERDMKENFTNRVDIDDVDGDTLSCLVQFLNRKPLEDLKWEAAVKLYYAADKYQIESLKNKCSLLLQKNISVRNVCNAFILSDMHQDEELKLCTQEFFCKNSKCIIRSKEWKDLVINRTKLAAEMLKVLTDSLKN